MMTFFAILIFSMNMPSYSQDKDTKTKVNATINVYKNQIAVKDRAIMKLNSLLRCCRDSIASLRLELAMKDSLIDVNNARLHDLEGIRQLRVKEILSSESGYSSRSYSSIDTSHVKEVLAVCRMLNSSQTDSLSAELTELMKRKVVFDSLCQAIETPYDSVAVASILHRMDTLCLISSEEQKHEIDDVRKVTEAYEVCYNVFPKIIRRISGFMADYRGDNADDEFAANGVKNILDSEFVDYNFKKYVAPIPYLVRRFEQFKEELLANPTRKTELEKELNIE